MQLFSSSKNSILEAVFISSHQALFFLACATTGLASNTLCSPRTWVTGLSACWVSGAVGPPWCWKLDQTHSHTGVSLSFKINESVPPPLCWRVCYQRGEFLPLGRDGVTITFLSSIHVVRTRPAVYKSTPPYRFERTRGIFGLPGQNKNQSLHKTDYCNVLSDFW